MLKFPKPVNFRQIIALSILCQRTVELTELGQGRGILPEQHQFLTAIQAITKGSKIQLAKSGEKLKMYPGLIDPGEGCTLELGSRCLSYYIEYLVPILLLARNPSKITLVGITNSKDDISADGLCALLNSYTKSVLQAKCRFKITQRGFQPVGKGKVLISISPLSKIPRLIKTELGLVKRIRGMASGCKINPSTVQRMVSKVRECFNDFIPNVWIGTDITKGAGSSGFGLSLWAETTNGLLYAYDSVPKEHQSPEQLGERVCLRLLQEIENAGTISTPLQSVVLTLMGLSEQRTSEVLLGRVTPSGVQSLRVLRQFVGVRMQVRGSGVEQGGEVDHYEGKVVFRCLGVGLRNLSMQVV